MKKLGSLSLFVLAVSLLSAQPLKAQRGPGGVLDWIHRLSGPSMIGPAGSYYWTVGEKARIRVSASVRFPVASIDKIEQGHTVNMLSLQPDIEIPIAGPLELNGGIALHRFGGQGHGSVWHFSVPLFAQVRIAADASENWFFRIGLGGTYFPSFDEEDFDGGVSVRTDGGEFPLSLIIGFDMKR